ncbi:sigma factor-like helix-turn-helix DNA-binding protein [Gemmatimonas aurantiaca]|uniref:RNA polymerase sigma factor n=1 Tax=Gemmatimonas aurantiaca TaxID=173480 RepID=UPI00301BD7F4
MTSDTTSNSAPPPSPDPESDEAYVQAMAQGLEPALQHLYARHAAVVYGLALRITGDSTLAADATVGTFAQAWSSAARYRGVRGTVLGWLTTMARIRALELRRTVGGPEHDVLAGGTSPLVVALPEETQQVLSLLYFGGLTQQEVADRLQVPLETVRRHVESGMRALRVKREVT